jgi:hypothetical protein
VDSTAGALVVGRAHLLLALSVRVPHSPDHGSVSRRRSSDRTCRSPASGSRADFTNRHSRCGTLPAIGAKLEDAGRAVDLPGAESPGPERSDLVPLAKESPCPSRYMPPDGSIRSGEELDCPDVGLRFRTWQTAGNVGSNQPCCRLHRLGEGRGEVRCRAGAGGGGAESLRGAESGLRPGIRAPGARANLHKYWNRSTPVGSPVGVVARVPSGVGGIPPAVRWQTNAFKSGLGQFLR